MRQEKRHKLQLFYEILVAVEGYMSNNNDKAAKPTHIQHTSRLSYDKMMNHFNELEHSILRAKTVFARNSYTIQEEQSM